MNTKTKHILIKSIIACLILFSYSLHSQPASPSKIIKLDTIKPTENEINELFKKCDNFFQLILTNNIQEAFTTILANSSIGQKQEQVNNLIEQTKKVNELYGKISAYEKISYEYVGKSLIKIKYITLHQEYPLKWTLTFYKSPEKKWIIINLKFDDIIEDLFEKD